MRDFDHSDKKWLNSFMISLLSSKPTSFIFQCYFPIIKLLFADPLKKSFSVGISFALTPVVSYSALGTADARDGVPMPCSSIYTTFTHQLTAKEIQSLRERKGNFVKLDTPLAFRSNFPIQLA
jgi:hypothetical protein